jgi:hypothetical protein
MSDNYFSDSTSTKTVPIIRVGEVISVIDTTKSGRIKVNITGVDDLETDATLIDCVPLLPKYLSTLPKVGECVFVFQYEYKVGTPTTSFKSKRFWIGPLITQPTKLSGEDYNDALSILPDGYKKLKDPNIELGVYGDADDITLQGRYNTDIIQKDRQIWIRTGKFQEGNPRKYNKKDLGFIQLKYGGEKLKREITQRKVVTKSLPLPKISIFVKIGTSIGGSTTLSGDLPPERYKEDDVLYTNLFIRVTNISDNKEINILANQLFNTGKDSRGQALSAAKLWIDGQGLSQYQIKSDAQDFITIYKGANGIAISDDLTPIEITKTIPEVKLVKKNDVTTSVINVVANKINLISHDGDHSFNLTDPEGLITDDEQEKINNEAHPLVYGDTLVEFLNLIKKYVISHVHPYNGLPPDPSKTTTDVMGFDLNKILNKNINSN